MTCKRSPTWQLPLGAAVTHLLLLQVQISPHSTSHFIPGKTRARGSNARQKGYKEYARNTNVTSQKGGKHLGWENCSEAKSFFWDAFEKQEKS